MRVVTLSSSGNIIGLLVLSTISISGLGTLMLASATLFGIVKLIGAFYLIYLGGIRQFRNGKQLYHDNLSINTLEKRSGFSYFKEGFLLAVTNPKPILFFTALFPQFLNLEYYIFPQFIVMTTIFMLFSFLSLVSYGFLSKTSKSLLMNAKGVSLFQKVSGSLFILMGGIGLLQLKRGNS